MPLPNVTTVVAAGLWLSGLTPATLIDSDVAAALRLAVACSVGWPASQTRAVAVALGTSGLNASGTTGAAPANLTALQLERINAAVLGAHASCGEATVPGMSTATANSTATRSFESRRLLIDTAWPQPPAVGVWWLAFDVSAGTTVREAVRVASELELALARQAAGDTATLLDALASAGFFEAVERVDPGVEWDGFELAAVNVTSPPVGGGVSTLPPLTSAPAPAAATTNSSVIVGAVVGALAAVGLLALVLVLRHRHGWAALGGVKSSAWGGALPKLVLLPTSEDDGSSRPPAGDDASRPPAQALLMHAAARMPPRSHPHPLPHRPGSSLSPPPSRAHHHATASTPGDSAGAQQLPADESPGGAAARRVALTPGRLAPHTRWGRLVAAAAPVPDELPDFRALAAPEDGARGSVAVPSDFRALEAPEDGARGSAAAPSDFVALGGWAAGGRGEPPRRTSGVTARLALSFGGSGRPDRPLSSGPPAAAAGAVNAGMAASQRRLAPGPMMLKLTRTLPPLPLPPPPARSAAPTAAPASGTAGGAPPPPALPEKVAPRAGAGASVPRVDQPAQPALRATEAAPLGAAVRPAACIAPPSPPAAATARKVGAPAAMLARLRAGSDSDEDGDADVDSDGGAGASGANDAPDWRTSPAPPQAPLAQRTVAAGHQLERSWGAAPLHSAPGGAAPPPAALSSVRVATGSSPLPPPGGWGGAGGSGGGGGAPTPSPVHPRRRQWAARGVGAGDGGALATARSAEKPGHSSPADHPL